jgi:hypothetical protein
MEMLFAAPKKACELLISQTAVSRLLPAALTPLALAA